MVCGRKLPLLEVLALQVPVPVRRFVGLRVLGSPGGCAVTTTVSFRATGLRRLDRRQVMSFSVFCFFFLCLTTCFSFVPDTGTLDIFTTQLDSFSQALPQTFCRFFLVFLRLVARAFFWGGWGSPCRVFLVLSPLVLGWGGGAFFSCLPLASCISSVGLS